MSFFGGGKIDCEKCGKWLVTTGKRPDGTPDEMHPAWPLLIRIIPATATEQIICPHCEHVNSRATKGRAPIPGARNVKIHIVASTREDRWGVSHMGVPYADMDKVSVSTSALQPIIDAFKANIERIDGVGTSLPLITGLTGLSGSKYSTYYTIPDEAESPTQEMLDNYMSQAALYLRFDDKMRAKAMQRGRGELRVWLLHHKPLQTGIETIFSSQIIATWTAIEVLASDLWEAALNSHPADLADLSGSPKRIKAGADAKSSDLSEDSKGQVPLADIRRVTRGDYDLSEKMGTLLSERFEFSRLSGIRAAYSTAFSKNHANIDNALRSVALDAASMARNLLVHSAGIADKEYVDRAKIAPVLPRLAIGESFPLNGDVSSKIIGDALGAAISLIKAVDGWLKSH